MEIDRNLAIVNKRLGLTAEGLGRHTVTSIPAKPAGFAGRAYNYRQAAPFNPETLDQS